MKFPVTFKTEKYGGTVCIDGEFAAWVREHEDHSTIRFDIKTREPWHVLRSLRGMVIERDYKPSGPASCDPVTFYGLRSLSDINEAGGVSGRVCIKGVKRKCFPSNVLVRLPDTSLVSIQVLAI